jgi:hypothetical protein
MYLVKDVSGISICPSGIKSRGFDLNRLNIVAKVGKVRID